MKRLTCEMCGSTDLVKQDGVFVCQSCGCKYSVEEAKKLMIDGTVEVTGTVKVDTSDKLKNLYISARQARDSGNEETAKRLYNTILQEDPTNWEPNFYVVYYSACECRIFEIASAVTSVNNCLDTVLEKIYTDLEPTEQKEAIIGIGMRVLDLCNQMFNVALNQQRKSNSLANYSEELNRFIGQATATATTQFTLGDLLEKYWGTDADIQEMISTAWKCGIRDLNSFTQIGGSATGTAKELIGTYKLKAQKYDSNIDVVKNLYSQGMSKIEVIKEVMKQTGMGLAEAKEYVESVESAESNQPTSSGGGCYVATAIYGSYDCPQVWTLRRYRDNVLAKTWHGRAFIHVYYAISPTLVKWFGNTEWFKKMWKPKLERMVTKLNASGVENTPYKDRNW